MLNTTLNRFLLITVFLCSSTFVWGKPRSSPKTSSNVTASRGGYAGYLAMEGPEPIFESLPPVDFNRLMLTPVARGVSEKVPEKEGPKNTLDRPDSSEEHRGLRRHEDLITHVESTAGGEYYAPHHRVDVESHEEGPEIFPEDLLFFYENGGKGAHGDKNYYIPFNVSPGDLVPQNQPTQSKATYRRER